MNKSPVMIQNRKNSEQFYNAQRDEWTTREEATVFKFVGQAQFVLTRVSFGRLFAAAESN